MSHSQRITLDDARAVLRLSHELRDLRADPAAQHRRLVDGLIALLGAHDGSAFGVEDYRRGRLPRFTRCVLSSDPEPTYLRYMNDLVRQADEGRGVRDDPFADKTVDLPDRRQTTELWDVIGGDRGQADYPMAAELIHAARVADGMVSFVRDDDAGDAVQLGVAVHRFGRAKRYAPRERALLHFAVGEVSHLMATGRLAGPAARPLPPRQAEVLRRLLAGEAPKQMARAMGLSYHTVREHIGALYARHGVAGREELTAAVLGL